MNTETQRLSLLTPLRGGMMVLALLVATGGAQEEELKLPKASDMYLHIYQLEKKARKHVEGKEYPEASEFYSKAQIGVTKLKAKHPKWNPKIVDACEERLKEAAIKLQEEREKLTPADMYFHIYQFEQKASKHVEGKEYPEAREVYSKAQTGVTKLKAKHPKWNPKIVDACEERLKEAAIKLQEKITEEAKALK